MEFIIERQDIWNGGKKKEREREVLKGDNWSPVELTSESVKEADNGCSH